ncbi:formate dehydrogenase accessory sulfurtransferase FdhD [Luteipulveratus mongoliensis]|uniref:Sulfur carrier protein FdhD n=1 Tax=Luteipulveratus mongoliensis TaxID=571913 RepID=A0A0K1JJL9_9MICO|nr:formate dehydrogenase accessory sulfurtransferase FdhD [Luteipulveratus mongoliensis]AKU16924.1 formate dehydrogenase [Luteipulveratus mongoliensis]
MGRVTARRPVLRINLDGQDRRRADTVASEEPLEIRLDGQALTVTMRTPGHDLELTHGLLRAEGIISSAADIVTAQYCAGSTTDVDGHEANTYNLLDVSLRETSAAVPVSAQRSLMMHSGCGVCGKTSIDALEASLPTRNLPQESLTVAPAVIAALPDRLREAQSVFARTGGTHAAGLFDLEGQALVVREDVGRHNAVDKVLGWAVMHDRPVHETILMVSSRASFEIVQKAAMNAIPVLATVSAPSDLAVDTADRLGITLLGFVRGRSLNAYSHTHRLASSS